jgi:hypothetical protein
MLTVAEGRVSVDDNRFFVAMAFAALAVVFVGFATSYYLWPLTRATHHAAGQPISPALPRVIHAHAAAFTLWILLFVAQVTLVTSGQLALHRRLGFATAWLIPVLAALGVATAVRGARDGWNPGGPYPDALGFMIVGVADIVIFSSLAIAGIYFRRRPDLHKRLMLLATLGGLMWPAITRMPMLGGRFVPMFVLLSALVLAPALHDFLRGRRTRSLMLSLGLAILGTFPLRAFIGTSAPWHAFAAWLVR